MSSPVPLNEDVVKDWLRAAQFPVPRGVVVSTAEAAVASFRQMSGSAVVKALVPSGRRGKAGGVRVVASAQACGTAAADLLGSTLQGYPVQAVYIEDFAAIQHEYYLSFAFGSAGPEMLVTCEGGVEIEEVFRTHPGAIVRTRIDPLHGISPAAAAAAWAQAGVTGEILTVLGSLTADLHGAFTAGDATLLELNPLAVDTDGKVSLVGAMMAVDKNALYRHPEWLEKLGDGASPGNARERMVALVSRQLPGGECQYVELDGDIGLLVGGGGAGLYQHDLVVELGGRPANHCVTPPTGADNRKLKVVLRAILENPNTRGLLVGFNITQMSRTDVRVRALVEVLDEKGIDTRRFPIVIRLFGAAETESRAMVAGRPNVHYVPRGTTLKGAVRLIVGLVAKETRERRR